MFKSIALAGIVAVALAGGIALDAVAVLGGAHLCPCGAGAAFAQAPAATSQTVAIHIEGMDCPACTVAIRIALKKLDGVKDAKVSFADKQAVVEYAPDRVTPEQLADAVNKLGYKASLPAKGS